MHAIETKSFENFLSPIWAHQDKLQKIAALVLLILGSCLIIYSAINQSALLGHGAALIRTPTAIPVIGGLAFSLGLALLGEMVFEKFFPIAEPALPNMQPNATNNMFLIKASTAGKCFDLAVRKGDSVQINQPLCKIECMKMEIQICAEQAGEIQEVHVTNNSIICENQTLFTIKLS